MKDSNNKLQDNLSLTAIRVLSIINMLKNSPHSEKELNTNLKECLDVSRSLSKESIWIYINTLKAIGFEITRPSKQNDFKYELKDHPYKLVLSEQEFKVFFKLKKYLQEFLSWEQYSIFDKIFAKIVPFLPQEAIKSYSKEFKFSSRQIDYSPFENLILQLQLLSKNNSYCAVLYKSQTGNTSEFKLLAEKLSYENGALYFWGYNLDLEESQYLRVDRIISVEEIPKDTNAKIKEPQKALFILYGVISDNYQPMEGEKIVSKNHNSVSIEVTYKNKFNLIQKLLSFGSYCEILEPEDLRKDIIRKLEVMSKIYSK